jgi:DNA-binding NtrC family response regulator
VGETRSQSTEARIVAATHLDLKRAVLEGRFRDDLYYRLRVVPIEVPPLRDRREDVEPLARYLLSRVAARHGRSMLLAPQALRLLLDHPWPANVRELGNALEYAVAVCRGQTIQAQDLPAEVREPGEALPGRAAAPRTPGGGAGGSERERLVATLDAHRWRREDAAAALGISRTTLWRRMRELGIEG